MDIPQKIREMMESDILECRSSPASKSEGLWNQLAAKYKIFDPDLAKVLFSENDATRTKFGSDFQRDLQTVAAMLEMILKLNSPIDPKVPEKQTTVKNDAPTNGKEKVFIVHGHDDAAKQEVARTLEKVGFEAVILHEQPDMGKTIIEKLEQYTDVSYAVVLYTPCDLGRAKEEDLERQRARQNVVFEHGLLIGRLGRDHVSALVKGDVETPGDISGVVYISMDKNDAWKNALAKNMRAVGLPFDMNLI